MISSHPPTYRLPKFVVELSGRLEQAVQLLSDMLSRVRADSVLLPTLLRALLQTLTVDSMRTLQMKACSTWGRRAGVWAMCGGAWAGLGGGRVPGGWAAACGRY